MGKHYCWQRPDPPRSGAPVASLAAGAVDGPLAAGGADWPAAVRHCGLHRCHPFSGCAVRAGAQGGRGWAAIPCCRSGAALALARFFGAVVPDGHVDGHPAGLQPFIGGE